MERPHGERRQHVQTQYSQNILIRANFQPEIREKTGMGRGRGCDLPDFLPTNQDVLPRSQCSPFRL